MHALYGVSNEDIEDALKAQEESGAKLGDILVQRGFINEEQLSACLAMAAKKETTLFRMPSCRLSKTTGGAVIFQLTLEGFVGMLISFGLIHYVIRLDNSGLIALFLFSATLTTRYSVILADVDLRNEAIDILALFAGIILAFVGITLALDRATAPLVFDFVFQVAGLNAESTLSSRSFSNAGGVFVHNLKVLFTTCVLTFVYRGYAAVLILAWNGCIWGVTLTFLIKQSVAIDGLSPLGFTAQAMVALTPHLALETVAYIVGSIAAIGLSRHFIWHDVDTKRFWTESRRFVLMGMALVVLGLGALVEAYWVHYILGEVLRDVL